MKSALALKTIKRAFHFRTHLAQWKGLSKLRRWKASRHSGTVCRALLTIKSILEQRVIEEQKNRPGTGAGF